ncbi:RAMP superfamily CRISPR-associated protein [Micromonospora sp. SH-82]|uniref:RAMP superfamily CRISPR-associated protein n=1 Tax=Micromonospora sp. SH-82 TaxID=3132938 RepID=UPI003EBD2994
MTLPVTFDITLEFLSDWHVGTGQGRLGVVDAEVRRDADRLPFVPAKTLVGVWRDACETVADTFDQAGDRTGAWTEWVTWLFGSQSAQGKDPTARAGMPPVPAALQITPAQAPAWLRVAVRNRPALAQAAVALRPGVTIDDVTGTAADRLLRVEERAIRSLRLHAEVRIAIPGTADAAEGTGVGHLPEPAELLLRAGARLVEGVGGKRNRGSGRVAVLLPGARMDDTIVHPTVTDPRLADLLATGAPPSPPAPPAARKLVDIYPYARRHADQRRTVRVALRVITPLVAAHDVLGNVIFSRDAIPGTAMLGTFLGRAEWARRDGDSRPARIGLGDVSVGDAVPAHADPGDPASVTPACPVPKVWHRSDKGRGKAVHNILATEPTREDRAKPMAGWIVPDDDGWQHLDPVKTVSTHAIVDDDARRPTVASGGVYTYLGIAPDTVLCTDVVLPAEIRLRLKRGDRLRFGRSRKDDFGLVEVVEVVDPLPVPPPPKWEKGLLRVWCVSDVYLRDERLAPDPSPQALARALSAALPSATFEVVGDGTAVAVTRREGFGVAWCRPRPSQVALQAGSVVTLAVTGEVDPRRLAEMERDGVGERTVEGYGRIRFNPPELAVGRPAVGISGVSPCTTKKSDNAGEPPVAAADVPPQAHPLEINAWRRAIRRASARTHPCALVPGIDGMAGNRAQLGSLRTQLERLTLPNGPAMVSHWLEATSAVPARRETWTEPVLKELAALLVDDPSQVWKNLKLDGAQPDLVLAPGREDDVRQHLHTEAVTTAVTDMLRRLVRQRRGTTETSTTPGTTAKERR